MVKKYANLKMIGLVIAVSVLMVLIVFLVGRSFGFFQYMKKGEVINVVTINGLSVNIDNTTDQALNLEDAYPMHDSEGLENDPFIFTMTNTSSKPIDYTLRLLNDEDKQEDCVLEDEVTPCTLLPYQYIKYAYSINNGSYSTPANLTSTGEIYSETIQGNGATTISIKLWIDSTAPNSIQGNAFFGKLMLTGEKSLFNTSLPSSIIKGDSYKIARETSNGETISCVSDKDGSVANTSALTTTGTHTITCTLTNDTKAYTSTSVKRVVVNALPNPVSFATDDWSTIVANVKAGNTSVYAPTDQGVDNQILREVDLGSLGTHYLRVANTTACTNGETSETACGFVVEFADIVGKYAMNTSNVNYPGGYPNTQLMFDYVTDTIYNALPVEIKNSIIYTTVVSGHGKKDSENFFNSNQKLYLLDRQEVFGDNSNENSAAGTTRMLDYYQLNNTNSDRIKLYSSEDTWWWLRSVDVNRTTEFGCLIYGQAQYCNAIYNYGVSPAFRIG